MRTSGPTRHKASLINIFDRCFRIRAVDAKGACFAFHTLYGTGTYQTAGCREDDPIECQGWSKRRHFPLTWTSTRKLEHNGEQEGGHCVARCELGFQFVGVAVSENIIGRRPTFLNKIFRSVFLFCIESFREAMPRFLRSALKRSASGGAHSSFQR